MKKTIGGNNSIGSNTLKSRQIHVQAPLGIVFGASGTLGQATIRKFKDSGGVVCGVLHKKKTRGLYRDINYYENCDISNPNEVDHVLSDFSENFGSPNFVVNCAGVTASSSFTDMTFAEWNYVLSVNLTGAFNVCQATSRIVIKKKVKHEQDSGCSIVLIGSPYGERHIPGLAHYCTSKAAVTSLAKVLSVELAKHSIRVNVISPGLFSSKMTQPFVSNIKYIKQLMNHIPDNMLGDAGKLAEIIYFLSTESCKHINGTEIVVDGGMLNLIEGGIVR